MNGAHDLGGAMGHGPIHPEPDEPVFHGEWEARMYALAVAAGELGAWTLDEDRHACENRPPPDYLRMSYYEIWHAAVSKLLAEKGLATPQEIAAGRSFVAHPKPARILRQGDIPSVVLARASYARQPGKPAAFALGVKVRTRHLHPPGHTRLPRYLRGKQGEIAAVHGAHVFPDANAHGKGENPQWLYTVRFTAQEVWGSDARDLIHADLWEPYLDPA